MQPKLPKKIKKLFSKKPSFKLLLIIAIILAILTGSAIFFTNSKGLSFNPTKSKLLNLIKQEDTEDPEEYSQTDSENTQNDTEKDQNDTSTTPEEEDEQEDDNESSNDKTDTQEDSNDDQNSDSQTDEDDDSQDSNDEESSNDDQDEEEQEPEPEPEPEPPESPSAYVAFYADTQSDTDTDDQNHQRVVNYILNSGANPIFHAGDLMEDGTQDSLDRFNAVTSTLRSTRTFYAALGNNDRKVGDSSTPSQLFLDNFSFPNNERWYSVNYGNLHMIVLDSAFASTSTSQINWLVSDLQSSNSQDRITGVMFHHPSFSSNIASYLVDYGADFIISGHLHSYNHYTTSGIDQFVLSGQPNIGYMVGRVYSDKIVLTAYNSGNGVIQTVTVDER